MPPLPDAQDPLVRALADTPRSVYTNYVLPAEQKAVDMGSESKLIPIRVVGALLIHSPSRGACEVVAQDITNAMSDPTVELMKLVELGQTYMDWFICHFIHKGGLYSYRSRPSVDLTEADMEGELVNTPQDHLGAKKNALIRDGYQCMLTGALDLAIYSKHGFVSGDENGLVRSTQCAHIMPESTNNFQYVGDKEGQERQARGVWAMLDRFGYGDIQKELEGPAIHSLGNVLTLQTGVHNLFEGLNLWLEPVSGKAHTYDVRLADPVLGRGMGIKSPVQFKVHHVDISGCKRPGPAYLPLPDPRYLELHAACCKVAHMSGAGQYLRTIFYDMGDLRVLEEDGRSAEVLVYAMRRHIAAG